MSKYIYVHNSNLLLEARRLSAYQAGLTQSLTGPNTPTSFDQAYLINVAKLKNVLTKDGVAVGKAAIFGSRPPHIPNFWNTARNVGFQTFIAKRVRDGMREEKIDAWMVATMFKDA